MWNLRKFTLALFRQKFRESNAIRKEVTKELISRNILMVKRNFMFLHTHCAVLCVPHSVEKQDIFSHLKDIS